MRFGSLADRGHHRRLRVARLRCAQQPLVEVGRRGSVVVDGDRRAGVPEPVGQPAQFVGLGRGRRDLRHLGAALPLLGDDGHALGRRRSAATPGRRRRRDRARPPGCAPSRRVLAERIAAVTPRTSRRNSSSARPDARARRRSTARLLTAAASSRTSAGPPGLVGAGAEVAALELAQPGPDGLQRIGHAADHPDRERQGQHEQHRDRCDERQHEIAFGLVLVAVVRADAVDGRAHLGVRGAERVELPFGLGTGYDAPDGRATIGRDVLHGWPATLRRGAVRPPAPRRRWSRRCRAGQRSATSMRRQRPSARRPGTAPGSCRCR